MREASWSVGGRERAGNAGNDGKGGWAKPWESPGNGGGRQRESSGKADELSAPSQANPFHDSLRICSLRMLLDGRWMFLASLLQMVRIHLGLSSVSQCQDPSEEHPVVPAAELAANGSQAEGSQEAPGAGSFQAPAFQED